MDRLINSPSREEVASQLHELRDAGDYAGAIALCGEAAKLFPNDYFYPQIASDLHFQMKEYDAAAGALAECLGKLLPGPKRFASFAQRYNRLTRAGTGADRRKWAVRIMAEVNGGHLDQDIGVRCARLIQTDLPRQVKLSEDGRRLVALLSTSAHSAEFTKVSKQLLAANSAELAFVLDEHILDRERTPKTYHVDAHCISLYEKMERYDSAFKVAEELLRIRLTDVVIRAALRICRKQENYQRAEELLARHPDILKRDGFQALYELVYYFEAQNSFEQAQAALAKMEKKSPPSLPILRTVKNFYTRLGMVDDVARVSGLIKDLQAAGRKESTKFQPEVAESEAAVPSKIQELLSEVEHQTRLAAISDLTTGISHELGQPITNIRYTVQFYRKMLDRKYTKERLCSAFDSILEETERMGGLMKRLSPLTSSKSVIETFDVVERIRSRMNAEKARLTRSGIGVTVSPRRPVLMEADPVKFDQLVGNLLLNAIDGISEKRRRGPRGIKIQVQERGNNVRIVFADTGVGIPLKNRGKLFDPFFSTKAPGRGEGLGLFIVWNLLKMQGGKISLDPSYKNGACFLITLPRITEDDKEL